MTVELVHECLRDIKAAYPGSYTEAIAEQPDVVAAHFRKMATEAHSSAPPPGDRRSKP